MLHIHPNARTTPATRAEIARSSEPSGTVAQRYGISAETVRKWRKRGVADCLDRSARPHQLSWKATEEERAVVCALRRATNFPLDDLTFIVCHFLPHLNRDSIWRILKAEGLNRRPKPVSERPAKGQGTFRDYDLGFVHIDIKHLPKLQTSDGERRKRFLFVAIDRCSRSVHLAVKDDETERSAMLARRSIADGVCAFFATWCPVGTGIDTLVAVEGQRWAIEDSFEAAKTEFGLDHNESRFWHGWHRHVSLVMLAFAMLASIRHHANRPAPSQTARRSTHARQALSVGRSRKYAVSSPALRNNASARLTSSPGRSGDEHTKPPLNAHI